ncbi:hypothetical protein PR048_021053 [Dryococelus australis]|uniref:HTH psq-type domain-containing protein n=1 Tax=Dryococelus australis TaxID=614101 RepID=A0ABQ9GX76_9NEOP|nr:hypothetical protein PR048_021053 [Dryococelus australis]
MSMSKPQRKKLDENAMESAIYAARKKEMELKKAAKANIVPRSTLKRYVNDHSPEPKFVVATTFLFKYRIDVESRYIGLTAADVRRLACQLVIRNSTPHQFTNDKAATSDVLPRECGEFFFHSRAINCKNLLFTWQIVQCRQNGNYHITRQPTKSGKLQRGKKLLL